MTATSLAFDDAHYPDEVQGHQARFSFVNRDPINNKRYLFTFDSVIMENRTTPGTLMGSPSGGDYRQNDFQVGPEIWEVDVGLATPIDELGGQIFLEYVEWVFGPPGDPTPVVRVPASTAKSWFDRSRDLAEKLALVQGAPLVVSFSRHGIQENLVLTNFSDRRGKPLAAHISLTFEKLRQAEAQIVQVPMLPRLEQQKPSDRTSFIDLFLGIGNPEEDTGSLLLSKLIADGLLDPNNLPKAIRSGPALQQGDFGYSALESLTQLRFPITFLLP